MVTLFMVLWYFLLVDFILSLLFFPIFLFIVFWHWMYKKYIDKDKNEKKDELNAE